MKYPGILHIKSIFLTARFDHWPKQIFFIPGILYCFYIEGKIENFFGLNFKLILSAFFCTSFIASANYVINEHLDSKYDKFHPLKMERALVKEKVNPIYVWLFYISLVLISFFISIKVHNFLFNFTLFSFLVAGLVYNVKPFRSKDLVLIDILSESINNPIRFLLGYFAVTNNLNINFFLLLSYWFGGAFLMSCKRYAEKKYINNDIIVQKYRPSLAFYKSWHLIFLILVFAIFSIICLYIFFLQTGFLNPNISFYFVILFIVYYMFGLSKKRYAQVPEKLFFDIRFIAFLALYFYIFFYKILKFSS